MIGLGTLARLAKGGMGIDEMSELLSQAVGGEVDITPVKIGPKLTQALLEVIDPESKAVLLSGTTRTGDRLRAVFILSPPEKPALPS